MWKCIMMLVHLSVAWHVNIRCKDPTFELIISSAFNVQPYSIFSATDYINGSILGQPSHNVVILSRAVVNFSTNRSCCEWALELHVHLKSIISLYEFLCMTQLLSWACCNVIMRNRCIGVLLNLFGEAWVHCNLLTLVVLVCYHRCMPDSSLRLFP